MNFQEISQKMYAKWYIPLDKRGDVRYNVHTED